MNITDDDYSTSDLVHVSDLGEDHTISLLDMTMAHIRLGGRGDLNDTKLKAKVKDYCNRNGINLAAALAITTKD